MTSIEKPSWAEQAWVNNEESELWEPGPWDEEPWSKLQWTDEETGYPCLAVRNRLGAWCGYVGLPEEHPWYGVSYSACPQGCEVEMRDVFGAKLMLSNCHHTPGLVIDVHGGVTYSNYCQSEERIGGNVDERHTICHIGEEERWWFGFDCAHAWDHVPNHGTPKVEKSEEILMKLCEDGPVGMDKLARVYRDLDFVKTECAKMAKQLKSHE